MSTLSRRSSGPPRRSTDSVRTSLSVQDLQSAWLLFFFCANAQATYSLRGIGADFTEAHDEASWQCLHEVVDVSRLDHGETGPRQPPVLVGRVWIFERHEVPCPSPLGELVGQFAHDLLSTSSPCRHDGPKLVGTQLASRHFDAAAACREELCDHGYGAPRVEGSSHSSTPSLGSSSPRGVGHSSSQVGSGMRQRSWSSSSSLRCCLASLRTSAPCSAP